jgi:cytidine deaminase
LRLTPDSSCAAVETTDGAIYTGGNIENASYGLTVCAERVAIWKAISEGVRPVPSAPSPSPPIRPPPPPCGACRQILADSPRQPSP